MQFLSYEHGLYLQHATILEASSYTLEGFSQQNDTPRLEPSIIHDVVLFKK